MMPSGEYECSMCSHTEESRVDMTQHVMGAHTFAERRDALYVRLRDEEE